MTGEDLQFDRAEIGGPPPGAVTCVSCGAAITDGYYSAGGKTLCGRCKTRLEAAIGVEGRFGAGLLLGAAGGLVGAGIYFGVTALSGYEIGLIAIVVGWLVGRGMQIGSRAAGGRKYQIAAVVITYLAIAGSYLALALRGLPAIGPSLAVIVAALLLPVRAGLSDPPGSLLSLVIIGIGLVQAWRMNRKPAIEIRGPFRIGNRDPAAAPADESS